MTSKEVCAAYSIGEMTLKRLVKAGLPCEGGGVKGRDRTFDPDKVAAYFKANPPRDKGRPDVIGGENKSEWDAAKIREKQARAKLLEIAVAEKEGRVIPKAEVERLHVALASAIRTRLMSYPPSLAANFDGDIAIKVEQLCESGLRSILTELSVL